MIYELEIINEKYRKNKIYRIISQTKFKIAHHYEMASKYHACTAKKNTTISMCMYVMCQIVAKSLVCAIDCHLDASISLAINHYRVVLTIQP